MPINQLKAGTFLSYLTIILNSVIGLIYTPFMLNKLGQSEYGLYSLVASVIAYLTVLDLGFGNAIIRYTSRFRALNKQQEQHEMFGMFLIIYTIIGIIAFLIGLVLYFNVENLFDRTMTPIELHRAKIMMMLMIFNLAFTFPMSIYSSIILAYEKFVFQKSINLIRIILNPIVMVCMLTLGYKAVAMVVIQTIFNVATLLINCWFCYNRLKIKVVFKRFHWGFLKEVTIYSFWIFLGVIMDKIYWNTGQFVLGVVKGTTAIAIYALAIQLQGMYMSFSSAISGVFLPKITSMVAKNAPNSEISNLFIKTGRIQYIVMSYILVGFIIFGFDFINVWAGNKYRDAYIICLIFFIPLTVPLIQNIGITILQARNQLRFRSVVYIIIALLSLGVSIPLSIKYSGIGCAIGTAFALTLGQIIVMNIYYKKKVGININLFWKEIIKMSIIPIMFCFLGLMINRYIELNSYLKLLVGIITFSIIYLPCFWFLSMNKYERDLFYKPVKSLINKIKK
ncbi:MAG: oligosaccharide flippase family protein [Bacteroidales bacterium]|jgi:O-antigen/teichoic acid export membrane protein|nr:oligosaccharide flippase family protein [Bacteroidales bacterium]